MDKQEYLGKGSVRNSREKELVMSIGPEAWEFIACFRAALELGVVGTQGQKRDWNGRK